MPDVWTKHPAIVRDLLMKGGVAPRFLKDKGLRRVPCASPSLAQVARAAILVDD